jgi:hypothetical protein
MEPELVAPAVAWLAHESCSISGEMLVAMVAPSRPPFIAESEGVYPSGLEHRGRCQGDRCDPRGGKAAGFPPVPHGELDHLMYGFDMARKNGA